MPTSPHWGSYEFAKDFRVWNYILPGGNRVCPYEALRKAGPDDRESARFVFAVPLTSLQVDPAVRQKRHALGL